MRIDPDPDPHFEYQIQALVRFTAGELRLLRHFAEQHYDLKCRSFFQPGSWGNAWRTYFVKDGDFLDPFDESCPADLESESVTATASVHHLDTCLKILEGIAFERDRTFIEAALKLRQDILKIVDAIYAEHKRIRGEAVAVCLGAE